ncbi:MULTISPECIES: cytochrome P450 [unclassified Kitasatospora]|uniref:cytochrome P450 n=1 Tax=unclassified Kitasatospora TaxID=2633591 RepID=UPI001FD7F4C5|nr:cytochrome P450 [Kitasatospora sp. RG8]
MESPQRPAPHSPPPGCPMHGSGTPLYGETFSSDPGAVYDRLRAHGHAAPVELAPGVDATLVTSHEAALRVLQNPGLFARDSRRWAALNEGRVPLDSPVLPMMFYRPNCLFTDGTEHLRLRKAVTESLERLNDNRLNRHVERIAGYLIDQFSGLGRADLINDYAKLLPLLLFNQLFGCPADIGDRLTRSMSALFDGLDVIQANDELNSCLMDLVALKRRQPGDDITSWLVQHPAGLRDEELKDQLVMLMGAGVEPERNLIGNALLVLLSGQGALRIEDAIDDVLWNNPPIANYATHFPMHDVEVGGVLMDAGSPVVISFAAANSDPALTDARLTLSKGAHLAWGAGPHACPAKNPAQLIALTAIECLLNALPDVALTVPAQGVEWRPGPFQRGLVSLPVRFSPTFTRTPGAGGGTGAGAVPGGPAGGAAAAPGTPTPSAAAPAAGRAPAKQKGWWSSFLDVFRL